MVCHLGGRIYKDGRPTVNIIEQIEALTELYRLQLGLIAWEDFQTAAEINNNQKKINSHTQSGRTERDILRAIAACTMTNVKYIAVLEDCNRTYRKRIYKRLENLNLLDIRVIWHSEYIGPCVRYLDHSNSNG